MAVTLSLVALFGLILFLLLRSKTLGAGSAFVAVMFGFFLASTGAAPAVNQVMTSLINAIPDL
ncbi:hypothetical protein M8Z33_20015 [Streptomyces sp. ZAF1911]|uniref:hypothetical protein n=1 Tax=unclassified Streptomyces TaxID=2593676 RepID=UPI00237A7A2F|nr:hypothetical protein [Streptomyces sp. ZAF1911]MDD9378904.1 hypothetical protein [Streptomyces sp. ZAF1911]